MILKGFKKILLIVIFSLLLNGCLFTNKNLPDKKYYILDCQRNSSQKLFESESVLNISKFRISPQFKGKNFVYRFGSHNYEIDFYNEFLISPDEMITDCTKKWLMDAGIFKYVMTIPGHMVPD